MFLDIHAYTIYVSQYLGTIHLDIKCMNMYYDSWTAVVDEVYVCVLLVI